MICFLMSENGQLPWKEKKFLEKLYFCESKRMWYTAVKILGNKEQAEDAVQQTFENLMKQVVLLMSFEEQKQVSKYVYIAVRNTAFAILRARKKTAPLEEDTLSFTNKDDIPNQIIRNMAVREIEKIVSEINPIYGDAFYLRYFMGMGYKDIACILSVSVSVAQHRASRGKALIKSRGCVEADG